MKEFNLKKLLKTIKLNENSISMVLGIIVVLIVSTMVVNFLKNKNGGSISDNALEIANSVELSQKIHKVEKDETLWNLAEKYYGDGFKWVDIATENKLANASIIEAGQELVIPSLEKDEAEAITSTTYEVQKGDTLWNIAIRAYGDGYAWVKIASENKLANPNIIHPGNILILPR